jgi:hypothetical protein
VEYSVEPIDFALYGHRYKVTSPPSFEWYHSGEMVECLADICNRHSSLCKSLGKSREDSIDISFKNHPLEGKNLYITRDLAKGLCGQYLNVQEFIKLALERIH